MFKFIFNFINILKYSLLFCIGVSFTNITQFLTPDTHGATIQSTKVTVSWSIRNRITGRIRI